MTTAINMINLKQEEINPDMFSKGMLKPFDEKYGESYFMFKAASFALVMAWAIFQVKAVFKKNKDVEPDD